MCNECGKSYNSRDNKWCLSCNSNHFKNNFKNWTSKNHEIDKFLQDIQCDSKSPNEVIEWIPYKRLFLKNQIGKGGYGTVNLANWLDGPIICWNKNSQNWNRYGIYYVALKILNKSNESADLLKEVSCYYLQLS